MLAPVLRRPTDDLFYYLFHLQDATTSYNLLQRVTRHGIAANARFTSACVTGDGRRPQSVRYHKRNMEMIGSELYKSICLYLNI